MDREHGLNRLFDMRNLMKNNGVRERLIKLFDEGTFIELDAFASSTEVITGYGLIDGAPVYAFAQDIGVEGGAIGVAQVKKIKKVYELAIKTGAPIVGIYDSKGAYLNEGVDVLAAYGELLLYANKLSGVVPQVSIIAGPCVGTSALIASSGDIVIKVKDAPFYLKTADKNEEAGSVHVAAPSCEKAIEKAREIISLLPVNNLAEVPIIEDTKDPLFDENDVITSIADKGSFIEFQQDYGHSVRCGLGRLAGQSVAFVSAQGDILDDASVAKAARLVRFADAFSIPVVTFIDAEGFDSIREAAKLSHAYAEATTVKVSVITGKAVGCAYIAMAGRSSNCDYVGAWPNAYISPLIAEAAVAVLWEDKLNAMDNPLTERADVVERYKETEASVFEAAAKGYVADIFEAVETRVKLTAVLDMLASKRVQTMAKKHSNIQL